MAAARSSGPKQAWIRKHATVHSLRHSFATNLPAEGTDIQHQLFLGHRSRQTTKIYTHVTKTVRHTTGPA